MSDLKQLVALLNEKAIALQAQFQSLREENGKLKQTIEQLLRAQSLHWKKKTKHSLLLTVY